MQKTTWSRFEVLIIENNSTQPETFRFYETQQAAHENLRVVRYEGGFNFSAINNFGRRAAQGDYLVLLNNDIEIITPDWIEQMLSSPSSRMSARWGRCSIIRRYHPACRGHHRPWRLCGPQSQVCKAGPQRLSVPPFHRAGVLGGDRRDADDQHCGL